MNSVYMPIFRYMFNNIYVYVACIHIYIHVYEIIYIYGAVAIVVKK